MKFFIAAAALSVSASLASAAPSAKASGGDHLLNCTAKVIQSEKLPFAPEGKWLVNATLEITLPNGSAYSTTLHGWMPWQSPPPRRGQAFRLACDPTNPGDLHLTTLWPKT
jgi:hypothetical protein